MPCFHPLKGWKSKEISPNGKRTLVFSPRDALVDLPLEVPCGQCIGCRLERSRQWAVRCVHEAQLHQSNSFITLTYNDENLPADRSLNLDHYQKFMKRLRKKFAGHTIRFYHCGEYGDKTRRPHYHAIIFGIDFPDKVLWKVNNGQKLFISNILSKLWPYGYSIIGDVTFESAAYVARYIMKKINGDKAEDHYQWTDSDGVVYKLKPEYTTMSRRPGIASRWFDKFKTDVYPKDFITINAKKVKPPKYYDYCLSLEDQNALDRIKVKRKKDCKKHLDNNTFDRLKVRKTCLEARLKSLPRTLD